MILPESPPPAPQQAAARLALRALSVRRLYGPGDEPFALSGLSEGINVLHGPNASGKTTAARAIAAALWPGGPDGRRASLTAQLLVAGSEISLSLDGGKASAEADGLPVALPPLPPVECRDRYVIGLPDLLAADGRPFAVALQRELAGGYDISAALGALGWREGLGRPNALVAAVREKRDRARAAADRQRELAARHERLASLEGQLEAARWAGERAGLLELALAYRERHAAYQAAKAELEAIDPRVARLDGREPLALRDCAAEVEAARAEAAAARNDLGLADEELRSSGLEADLPSFLPGALGSALETLRAAETALRERADEEARAAAECARWRGFLGRWGSGDRTCLDLDGIGELAGFTGRALALDAQRLSLDVLTRRLGPPTDGALHARRFEEGLDYLAQWSAASRQVVPGWAWPAALLLAAAGAGLSEVVHPLAGLLALAAVALLYLSSRRASPAQAAARQAYERLALPIAATWDAAGIAATQRQVATLLASARLDELKAAERGRLAAEGEELAARSATLDRERNALVARLGVAPATLDPQLPELLDGLRRLRESAAREDAAAAAAEAARQRRDEALDDLRRLLAPHLPYPARTVAELSAQVADLSARQARRAAALAARATALRRHKAAEEAGRRAAVRRDELLARVGLEASQFDTLARLCDLIPTFQEARKRHLQAEATRREARGRVDAHPLSRHDPLVTERDLADLREELKAARALATEFEGLRDEISAIRSDAARAGREHALDASLAELERATNDLAARRDAAAEAAIGLAVAAELDARVKAGGQAPLLARADEILASVTRGRYRLRYHAPEGAQAEFRAFDTKRERGFALDELSGATRAHLLLAVRVAFLEGMEGGLRLPLILDEALANADDERASALIGAAIELAREGRQVFYFTAQSDEVDRWRDALAASGVPHAIKGLRNC